MKGSAGELPAFAELPRLPKIELSHAWEVFGPGDELGTLNLITPDVIRAALSEVRRGDRVSLTLPMNFVDPPMYGRQPYAHETFALSRNEWDDRLDGLYLQSASQWDGFRHVRCREFGFYGGETRDPAEMGPKFGIDRWADGIISRGVLLDVARYLEQSPDGGDYHPLTEFSVTAGLLEQVARFQGVDVRRGDVLCVRLGWASAYRQLSGQGRQDLAGLGMAAAHAGLAADEVMAARLWDWHISAIVTDNPSVELAPGSPAVGSLHRRLLPLLGMVMGELFDLDQLAARCAADGRWSFMFAGIPMNLPEGVASPGNAVALR